MWDSVVCSEGLNVCVTSKCVSFQPNLVEEYFEAHSSSKVLTSDRTLQKLKTPKLDRVSAVPPSAAAGIQQSKMFLLTRQTLNRPSRRIDRYGKIISYLEILFNGIFQIAR